MATVLESVAITGYNMGIWLFLLTLIMGAITVRRWQSGNIKMYYQPSNKLWSELLTSTDLLKIKYKPSIFALNATMQLFWFGMLSIYEMLFGKVKYHRQIFELSDGGELALDWLIHPVPESE